MNNAEMIKALQKIQEGITLAIQAMGTEVVTPVASLTEKVEVAKKAEKVEKAEPKAEVKEVAPVAETKKAETVDNASKIEELNSMKYNDLKKYASSLGIDCKGTRVEITNRVLAFLAENGTEEATEETEVVEEVAEETEVTEEVTKEEEEVAEAEKKSEEKVVSLSDKKLAKKKEEKVADKFDTLAQEVLEEADMDYVIEALEEVGVKANKANALVKLAEALRTGLIVLEEDEEDEEEEVVVAEDNTEEEEIPMLADIEEDEEEEVQTMYNADYDLDGVNNPTTMTEARAKAVSDMVAEKLEEYQNDTLKEQDIIDFLEAMASEEEVDLLPEEYEVSDLFELYLEIQKKFIDDDGDSHEPSDPCLIGEDYYCCGHKLKYSKKTKKYVCEQCGDEYDAE